MTDSPRLRYLFADADNVIRPISFTHPSKVLQTHNLSEVLSILQQVERAVQAGFYAAGFVCYEATPAFNRAFASRPKGPLPLVWFGLFREPNQTDWAQKDGSQAPLQGHASYGISNWHLDTDPSTYQDSIRNLREAIARGDVYQVNYTTRLKASFTGDSEAFFAHLVRAQRGSYNAYIDLGRFHIASASPELFFRWRDNVITTRPMKGTANRGRYAKEDEQIRDGWLYSEKNRAENLMITDLLRNDLSRIARVGTVDVTALYEAQAFPTVWQLTSTIRAITDESTGLTDLFAALFPCGSITGAPKAMATHHIAALETSPRGVYCGAIGFIRPSAEAVFSVGIRTATIDTHAGTVSYGSGGGVTWDSTAQDEFAELKTKARVLDIRLPQFSLLETIRLDRGRYHLLELHLERLETSAQYFQIPVNMRDVANCLQLHAKRHETSPRRVRLTISAGTWPCHYGDISISVESTPQSEQPNEPQPIALATRAIDPTDPFLFHKTTNRATYDAHRAEHPRAFDVLLWNPDQEITEFTIGNVVLELDGKLVTPALTSGLLAGTFRQHLLTEGIIHETVLTLADIKKATQAWLINSVRGWVPVYLMDDHQNM